MPSKDHPRIAEAITDDIRTAFGDALQAVLLYGSARTGKTYWDLDMLVVLAQKDDPVRDLERLRVIRNDYTEQTLDLQLFYWDEVIHPELFSLDAHGAFFTSILAQATALYGENPFIRDETPSEEQVITSLLTRIQRYIFQARQEYIGIGRHNKDKNPDYHRKHVLRTVVDLMLMHGVQGSVEECVRACKKTHPLLFTREQWKTLRSGSDSIETFIPLYERVYETAIATATAMVPGTLYTPQRSSHAGIAYEYLTPKAPTGDVVVLIDGLPRKPDLTKTMSVLALRGYTVFFPRLLGTWESGGVFLDHDPAQDIRTFVRALRDGELPLGPASIRNVFLVGSSFGASVALHAGTDRAVSHTIALSPMYAPSHVPGLDTLQDFLRSTYPGAYRFSEDGWDAFMRDTYLAVPDIHPNILDPQRYTVIVGKHDTVTPPKKMLSWTRKNGIETVSLDIGHVSLHKDIRIVHPTLLSLLAQHS